MNFVETMNRSAFILTEGAVIERLNRDPAVELDPHVLSAGLIYDDNGRKALEKTQGTRRLPKEKRAQPYLIVLHDMCIECHKEIKANDSYANIPVACWRCHVRKKR